MGILKKASQSVIKKVPLFFDFKVKLTELKLKKFRAKFPFIFEYKDYIVKTAESPKELKEIIKLRYRVFFEERLGANSKSFLDEFDSFDLFGDHIILKKKSDDKIIGCYRVISSQFAQKFYSETEFDITDLLMRKGNKLELGRACIDKDYRNGVSIYLVWKGLARYIQLSRSQYLFGCSSADFSSPALLDLLEKQLKLHKDESIKIQALAEVDLHKPKGISCAPREVGDLVPPLLRSYIAAGARVFGTPIFDPLFQTYDFFTILDMDNLSPKFRKKFFDELDC